MFVNGSFGSTVLVWVLALVNYLFNRNWVFYLLGRVNREGRFIKSVLLTYAADDNYAKMFAFESWWEGLKWRPYLIGVFRQNGKWGLTFVVAARDSDFVNKSNAEEMKAMAARMEEIRCLMGAERATYGGALPAYLPRVGIAIAGWEKETTVAVLTRAIEEFAQTGSNEEFAQTGSKQRECVVIPHGKNSIENELARRVQTSGIDVYAFDWREGHWPAQAVGRPIIFLVIARGVLGKWSGSIPNGSIVLHEIYPPLESNDSILASLKKRDCVVFQVAGTKGDAWPKFPGVYAGGLPCCAGWEDPNMELWLPML